MADFTVDCHVPSNGIILGPWDHFAPSSIVQDVVDHLENLGYDDELYPGFALHSGGVVVDHDVLLDFFSGAHEDSRSSATVLFTYKAIGNAEDARRNPSGTASVDDLQNQEAGSAVDSRE